MYATSGPSAGGPNAVYVFDPLGYKIQLGQALQSLMYCFSAATQTLSKDMPLTALTLCKYC